MGRVVCAAAERAVKSDLNQQGFLFESSIVTVNHFDYTGGRSPITRTQLHEPTSHQGLDLEVSKLLARFYFPCDAQGSEVNRSMARRLIGSNESIVPQLVFASKSGFENRTNIASISLGKYSATLFPRRATWRPLGHRRPSFRSGSVPGLRPSHPPLARTAVTWAKTASLSRRISVNSSSGIRCESAAG